MKYAIIAKIKRVLGINKHLPDAKVQFGEKVIVVLKNKNGDKKNESET